VPSAHRHLDDRAVRAAGAQLVADRPQDGALPLVWTIGIKPELVLAPWKRPKNEAQRVELECGKLLNQLAVLLSYGIRPLTLVWIAAVLAGLRVLTRVIDSSSIG
jgi:hypothetical protein